MGSEATSFLFVISNRKSGSHGTKQIKRTSRGWCKKVSALSQVWVGRTLSFKGRGVFGRVGDSAGAGWYVLQSHLYCSHMAGLFEPLWVLQFDFKNQIWMVLVFKTRGPCEGVNLDALIMSSISHRFGPESHQDLLKFLIAWVVWQLI